MAYKWTSLEVNKIWSLHGKSESEAARVYRECYRHSNYKVLSVVPTGRDLDKEA